MTHSSSKFENMAMNSGQFYATTELLYCEFQTFFSDFLFSFFQTNKVVKAHKLFFRLLLKWIQTHIWSK